MDPKTRERLLEQIGQGLGTVAPGPGRQSDGGPGPLGAGGQPSPAIQKLLERQVAIQEQQLQLQQRAAQGPRREAPPVARVMPPMANGGKRS